MDTATARNAPCHCGSGKRFKHCHGAEASAEDQASMLARALSEHKEGRLGAAEALYRRALEGNPDHYDALHMLAIVRLSQGAPRDALALLLRALDLTSWRVDDMRTNLGFVLAALANADAQRGPRAASGEHAARAEVRRTVPPPLVSIVVPSFNHARFLPRTLRSVREQDYPNLELVVVDDGSSDDSVFVIEGLLRDMPFPARLIARENRGADATLNEGIAATRGDYVQFLNSDDALAPSRVTRMVDAVVLGGAAWGFSAIAIVDAQDQPQERAPGSRAAALHAAIEGIVNHDTIGLALLSANVAVSSGNIFVSRALAGEIGGFRTYRYNHDWDFCLRALAVSEPVFVPEPLYVYRLHGANTIIESSQGARQEAHEVVSEYLRLATGDAPLPNPFAPSLGSAREAFLAVVFSRGMAGLLEVGVLQRAAADASGL